MKKGKLSIIGIGPGNDEQITPAALGAIKEADAVIGYSTYINLVKHLLAGKQVTYAGMAEEIARAQKAVQMAQDGQNVALVSSGDAGVYGMAGLVFEVLRNIGWKRGDSPEIRMVPGVTADSSCASLVGAPLVHDAARISLSDLLTPWSVIEKRIEAAASGDFVINLYNPASGRRQRQIVEAVKIIKKYRSGQTPVGLVKSAYRKQQSVVISDLDHFLDFEIGMNTTVIIGSSNTFVFEGYMVTPRGYGNKYELADGALKSGQQRAVSLKYDGDLAGRFSKNDAAPGLNITKIGNVFHKPKTSVFAAIEEQDEFVTDSAASALHAIGIVEELEREKKDNPVEIAAQENLAFLGRLGGAMLVQSANEYYLIGKPKQPVDFSEYGFEAPGEYENFTQLTVEDAAKTADIKYDMLSSVSAGEFALAIYQRFAIYRNSSISERLVSYVTSKSQRVAHNGGEFTDVRWLAAMPQESWEIIRDSLLKC